MATTERKKLIRKIEKETPVPTLAEVKRAIRVILADKRCYTTSLNYAVGYCQAALGMEGKELEVQILYILNNITHWRSVDAVDVRKTLRAYIKKGE